MHHHSVSVQSIEVQRILQSRPVELAGFNAAPVMNRLLDGMVLQLKKSALLMDDDYLCCIEATGIRVLIHVPSS